MRKKASLPKNATPHSNGADPVGGIKKFTRKRRKEAPDIIEISTDSPAPAQQLHDTLASSESEWQATKDRWADKEDARYEPPSIRQLDESRWQAEQIEHTTASEAKTRSEKEVGTRQKKRRKRNRKRHVQSAAVLEAAKVAQQPMEGEVSGIIVEVDDSGDDKTGPSALPPSKNNVSSGGPTLLAAKADNALDAAARPKKSPYFQQEAAVPQSDARASSGAAAALILGSRRAKRKGLNPLRVEGEPQRLRQSSGSGEEGKDFRKQALQSTTDDIQREQQSEAELTGSDSDQRDRRKCLKHGAEATTNKSADPHVPDWMASATPPPLTRQQKSPTGQHVPALEHPNSEEELDHFACLPVSQLVKALPELPLASEALKLLKARERRAVIGDTLAERRLSKQKSFMDSLEERTKQIRMEKQQRASAADQAVLATPPATSRNESPIQAKQIAKATPVQLSPEPVKLVPVAGEDSSYNRNMRIALWEPPVSPYFLIEEALYNDPWKLLVACMLLNKTTGRAVRKILWRLFELAPTPEAAAEADTVKVEEIIKPLGLFRKRAVMFKRFSKEYLEKDWTTPQQLHGIGQYAADAYYIFCRNQWRKRQPPQDKDLLKYYEWLRLTGGEGTGCQREIFAAPASSASATSIEAVAQSDNGSSKAQPFVPMARSS